MNRPPCWLPLSLLSLLLGLGGLLSAAPPDRSAKTAALGNRTRAGLQTARSLASKHGLPIAGVTPGGASYQLIRAENGRVVFYQSLSANAAITTNTHIVRNTAPYNVNGAGFTVGVWDAGWIRTTHEALTPRVTIGDGNFIYDPVGTGHATSVTGVIAASLVAPANYVGMAPSVNILGFDSLDDLVEMAGAGAAVPNDPGRVYLSNHSYGILSGWEFGNYSGVNAYHFFGDWPGTPLTESNNFGIYLQDEVDLDDICFDMPYYLPVISAGNDRDDAKPSTGQPFYYYYYDGVNFPWYLVPAYDPALHPGADGVVNGGFDTIQPFSGAKNTLCVGAINDGQFGGARDLAYASMSSFSGWGPMDDGRIKPDLVGNGVGLFGLRAVADTGATTAYRAANDLNGTSFSAPNVTGSAVLLHQLYSNLFSGQVMRASTLKALMIHTADDITSSTGSGHPSARVGPDYSTGWGVMNTRAAADLLAEASNVPSTKRFFEEALDGSNPSRGHLFESDGLSPIRVTICWTDPPGSAKTALDDRTPVLVNDLDLRISGPGGSPTFYPYILDVENPANAATAGDNVVDNVEQILISAPTAGTYTITVGHKGTLGGGSQTYSLFQSGLTGLGSAPPVDDGDGISAVLEDGAPNGGDGNDDGISDSVQPNVASLPNGAVTGPNAGEYLTIVSPPDTQLANVTALPAPSPLPDGVASFPVGLVDFVLTGSGVAPPNEPTHVSLIMEQAPVPSVTSYFKHIESVYTPFSLPVLPITGGFTGAAHDGLRTWTLTLTDAAPSALTGDLDPATGSIRDPGGPAVTAPLLVLMGTLSATPVSNGVLIQWTTLAEVSNAGFNIHRAEGEGLSRLNPTLIPAAGVDGGGASYSFLVEPAIEASYYIESVDLNGTRTLHGPVSATLDVSGIPDWSLH